MLWIRILLVLAFSWILSLIFVGIGVLLTDLEFVFFFILSLIVVLLIYAIKLLTELNGKIK